jgi:hypothetical protein
MTSITALPDSTPVYVDGHGSSTLGEVRHAAEDGPALSDWDMTLEMYADLASLNLCRHPWEEPVSHTAIREFHASRSTGVQPRQRST